MDNIFSVWCKGDRQSNKQLKRAANGREMQLESRMKLAAGSRGSDEAVARGCSSAFRTGSQVGCQKK